MAAGEPIVLLDVRTPGEYAARHALGARLLPLDRLDPEQIADEFAGQAVHLICQSGQRASQAAEKLARAGFANAIVVEGGTAAWASAGLPCESTGRGVMSIERQVRIGAGSLVLLGVTLGWLVHPAFLGLSALIGAGLVFAGITDWCGMGLLLAKMPWNRGN